MKEADDICAELLEQFQVAKNVEPDEIENFKIHTSQMFAMGSVYAFDYLDKHYYVVDDYSLSDEPALVKDILLDINHLLRGKIVKNPTKQSDGAKYAAGLDGVEYYLWEV